MEVIVTTIFIIGCIAYHIDKIDDAINYLNKFR